MSLSVSLSVESVSVGADTARAGMTSRSSGVCSSGGRRLGRSGLTETAFPRRLGRQTSGAAPGGGCSPVWTARRQRAGALPFCDERRTQAFVCDSPHTFRGSPSVLSSSVSASVLVLLLLSIVAAKHSTEPVSSSAPRYHDVAAVTDPHF